VTAPAGPQAPRVHLRRGRSQTCELRQLGRERRSLARQVFRQSTPTRPCQPVTTRRRKHPGLHRSCRQSRRLLTAAAATCATLHQHPWRDRCSCPACPQAAPLSSPIAYTVPVDWRRSYTSRTAMEPSPMAAAARLTDPLRTSPAAKIPGLLVSRTTACCSRGRVWLRDIAAGEQEAVAVLGELAGQPLGSGLRADEDEQRADGQVRLCGLARAADPHALQVIGPDQLGDLRVWRDGDAGLALDPVHQVTRHRRVKRVSPDDHVYLTAAAAQEERGLPDGVAAAHDGDRPAAACLGLGLGGRVVDADAFELGEPVQGQPVVVGSGGDDDRLGLHVPRRTGPPESPGRSRSATRFPPGRPARFPRPGSWSSRLMRRASSRSGP
jgi:hypothetical protein